MLLRNMGNLIMVGGNDGPVDIWQLGHDISNEPNHRNTANRLQIFKGDAF